MYDDVGITPKIYLDICIIAGTGGFFNKKTSFWLKLSAHCVLNHVLNTKKASF